MLSARRKRHLSLAGLAVAGYLAGLPASRLLDSSRAVILERRGDRIHLAYLDRMPRWRVMGFGDPGDILAKARGTWSAKRVRPEGSDALLTQLYARYHATYSAAVVAVEPPEFIGGPAYAVAEAADGAHLRILLATPHLAAVRVGMRLAKKTQTWDPTILP